MSRGRNAETKLWKLAYQILKFKFHIAATREFLCGKPARHFAIEVTVNLTAL